MKLQNSAILSWISRPKHIHLLSSFTHFSLVKIASKLMIFSSLAQTLKTLYILYRFSPREIEMKDQNSLSYSPVRYRHDQSEYPESNITNSFSFRIYKDEIQNISQPDEWIYSFYYQLKRDKDIQLGYLYIYSSRGCVCTVICVHTTIIF